MRLSVEVGHIDRGPASTKRMFRTFAASALLAGVLVTTTGCPPLRPTCARWGEGTWPTTLPTTQPTDASAAPAGDRRTFRIAAVQLLAPAPPEAFVDQLRDHDRWIESVLVLDGSIVDLSEPSTRPIRPPWEPPRPGTPEAQYHAAIAQRALDSAMAQARRQNAHYLVCFSGSGTAHQGPTVLTFLNILIVPIFILPNVDVRGGCEFRAVMVDVASGNVVAVFTDRRHDNALATGVAARHGEQTLLTAMSVRGSAQVAHDVTDYLRQRHR